jgi:D-alanyl-lipoteichoic acid acyltransferase DltB (MBOAT superfamily)
MMFEAIAFFADIYMGKLEVSGSWWSHVVFAMYFPTRIIGPLRKYQDFTEQLARVKKPSPQEFAEGGGRILVGVLKKAVIANPVGSFAVFSLQPALIESGGSRATLGLGAVAYWIYLYFDLSGYSDIVIGLSRLFGLRIQENFQRPYAATNISEYWQRWHMSLSSWVREYVYTPVAIWARGSRFGPPAAALVSMVVLGLWHGLELRYLLFGLWQGVMLAGFMFWRDATRKTPLAKRLGASRTWTLAGWTSVIVSAVLSHVFFAVPSARLALRWFRVVLG